MAKTCIRVEACNIGSSERHNLRSKELDYIRPELTHRNEQWVECSIAEVHRDITEKYKEATGQGLQKKATPIREGVIVISEETTIQQLQDLAEKLEERFGVHAFQIYTHKDEGANVWDGKEEAWKPNYHAHMIFDWTDGHTGKTVKLNRHDMAEMQTITAECLNMERGVSSDKKHLSAMQYKNKMETEKAEQLQKDIEQLNRVTTKGAISYKTKRRSSTFSFKLPFKTLTRYITNIEIDKQGNKKEANIYGQWSFGDPSFSTIYFGGEHYWDIDELTKNKFSFYDRSGKFGDPFMNREYIELTPYQENNTTN